MLDTVFWDINWNTFAIVSFESIWLKFARTLVLDKDNIFNFVNVFRYLVIISPWKDVQYFPFWKVEQT